MRAPSAPSASSSATSASTTSKKDDDDDKSVLVFAYGALMDPRVIQSRLQGKEGLSLRSSRRPASAVTFAGEGGGARESGEAKKGERRPKSVAHLPSHRLAVAFVHRGGWATLVDLQKARALSESPLWLLVPGSQKGEEERGGGGWSERGEEKGHDVSFVSGPCFSSPAHGVLYALSSESELGAVAEKEGGYSLRKVEVRVDEARETLEAFAFVSSPGLCVRYPLPPRERYLEKMRAGAKEAKLDKRYIAWLERVPSTNALDGRYQATPAGAVAAAAGVAIFALVVYLLV